MNSQNTHDIHDFLLRSLDSELTEQEQVLLQAALEQNADLLQAKQELLQIRQQLSQQAFDFSADFNFNVCQKIRQLPTPSLETYIGQLFPHVAASAAAAIIVLVGYAYWQSGSLSFPILAGTLLDNHSVWDWYGI